MLNRCNLTYQNVRQGNAIQTTKLAVCRNCKDVVRPPSNPVIQPDGVPIQNSRIEPARAPIPDGGT
jgi:hypothetical protein